MFIGDVETSRVFPTPARMPTLHQLSNDLLAVSDTGSSNVQVASRAWPKVGKSVV